MTLEELEQDLEETGKFNKRRSETLSQQIKCQGQLISQSASHNEASSDIKKDGELPRPNSVMI